MKPEHGCSYVFREEVNVSVIPPDGFVVISAIHSNPIFRAGKFVLQPQKFWAASWVNCSRQKIQPGDPGMSFAAVANS